MKTSWSQVHHMLTDTLALIEILSDPANRAPLEAERALAEDWYHRQSPHEPPDSCAAHRARHRAAPFRAVEQALGASPTTTPAAVADIQFQPLSTVFRADCTEYGLVVLDISDLDSGVKYSIVAFPVDYMAEVPSREKSFSWDPVEDPQPETEPDIILVSPRPRVPLSIARWAGKYYSWSGLEDHLSILRLEERPLVDAAALDYWPQELEDPARGSSKGALSRISPTDFKPSKARSTPPRSPSDMVGYTIVDEPPRDVSMSHAKDDGSTTRVSSMTISDEPPRTVPVDMDRTIDNLLVLTQEPVSPPLDNQVLAHLQTLVPFREKLRQRLEEGPDRLGLLQYFFMRIRQPTAGIAPIQQSSSVEMVGGLTDFLRETVPGTDTATWEKRVKQVEKDWASAFTRPSSPSTPSSTDFATGQERANESFRRLAEASTGISTPSTPPERDLLTGEEPVVQVEGTLHRRPRHG
ncbi:uncharacterized protein APUU_60941A [Aspergillus puulaauensis]|uniref:Uncharacterized protein n=1 Tax=Aspergillus puulaauensis TaxID=1220207 RepID=A0A7R8ASG2_9EURO|nr:uncharacterized protein APUU_60941A [Aspergillus puulaauensis]BCS27893.1 hypothetical protein APUU_60941A [Aspergillus puulaauensis]